MFGEEFSSRIRPLEDTVTTDQHPAGAPAPDAHRYTAALAADIEQSWQDRWEERGTFHAVTPEGDSLGGPLPADDPRRAAEKFYVLDMFPYPSGKGLHTGHPLGYIATDVVARYQRMKGRNVLHALGYDAFGLPAEQYAVQTGQHPRTTTEENVANMRRQLRRLGLGHDARRSFATTDEDFVHWTQWIFRLIFESWYDPAATRHDGSTGTARPIADLVQEFASGQRDVPGGRSWADLSAAERAQIVDGYRLAYISDAPVNWCPGLGTVLANEEVTPDGRSERGNYPVFQRNLRQWMLRITAYGDRLVDDLEMLDWPEKVRSMQRHWIGRSTGAQVDFAVAADEDAVSAQAFGPLRVFTTRADTLFGATFMVVSPEHPLVSGATSLVPQRWPEGTKEAWTGGTRGTPRQAVADYQAAAAATSAEERTDDARVKTGVFSGLWGVNPVNGHRVPIFVADYVLMGYGTGAIMAVPAHDQRDFEFARAYDLPITLTMRPDEGALDENGELSEAWAQDGEVINSASEEVSLNGLVKEDAKERIHTWLEASGHGSAATTFRLRDWLFSRQRYWGEPFPIVYDEDGVAHSLPEDMLPVRLPDVPDYSPRTFDANDADSEPEPPLGRLPQWVNVELDLGDGMRTYRRETNTMPQWAGSSWYVLRYLDPQNTEAMVSADAEHYWMGPRAQGESGGADLYVGGVEHAVLHLLYARFWHKVLYDRGVVSSLEPFHRLFNQGYIQAYAFADARGQYVPADEVQTVPGGAGDGADLYTYNGEPVTREYGKMGKSLKNIVTPDEMYDAYGADTFRVYEMAMGPLDVSRPWNTRDVIGSQRFLQRLWRNVIDEATGEVTVTEEPASEETRREVAAAIDAVRTELDGMRMNTAIAKMIVLNNHLTTVDRVPREAIEPLILMVAPIAPHIAEELWRRLGHTESLAYERFPEVSDRSLLVQATVTCVVQVKGKVRDRLEVAPDISEDDLRALALGSEKVASFLTGQPRKVIVRAPNLVNVVP